MFFVTGTAEQITNAISSSIITIIVCVAVVALISLAILVWFVWTMCSINRNIKSTAKSLNSITKQLSSMSLSLESIKTAQSNQAEELSRYKALLDQGAITEEEFALKKIQILNR